MYEIPNYTKSMVSWQLLIFITEHKKEGFSYWLKVFSFCSQFSVCFKPLINDNKAKWSVRVTKHLTSHWRCKNTCRVPSICLSLKATVSFTLFLSIKFQYAACSCSVWFFQVQEFLKAYWTASRGGKETSALKSYGRDHLSYMIHQSHILQ